MALQARELLIVVGGGVSLGLAATVLDTTVFEPSDGQQYSRPTTESLTAEQAQLEAEFHAKLDELRRLENEASSPAQQWAEGVLASGQPLTIREIATLSKIVNGQPGVSRYSDYSGSNYTGAATSASPATSLQNGSQSRSILDEPSASRAWLEQQERAATADYAYQGASGTRYRYDLSNPSDNLKYGVDPMSQLNDSISVDPRRDIDRSIGQYGGGIGP